jgi:hypothetical protein
MDTELLKKLESLRERIDPFYNFFIYLVSKGKLLYK